MYKFKSNGSKLDIVTVGNPILRQKCEAVGKFSSEVAKLAEDMLITMRVILFFIILYTIPDF